MRYSFVSRAVMKRGASDEMNVPALGVLNSNF